MKKVTKGATVGLLVFCLIFGASTGLTAPNKIWLIPGTALKFADAAQTPAVTFTLTGVTAGAAMASARYDKNALVSPSGAMPYFWRWACTLQLSGTGVIGDVLEMYVSTSDGTLSQGNFGTTSATFGPDLRKNLTFMGIIVVDKVTSNPVMVGAGYVEIRERYFSLGLYNGTSLPLVTNTGVHTCYMTPHSVEIQAYAPLDYDRHPEPATVPQFVAA